jgi:rubrerythrin
LKSLLSKKLAVSNFKVDNKHERNLERIKLEELLKEILSRKKQGGSMSIFTKNDIIEMAVKMEQNGYAFYDKALQRSDLNIQTKSILTILRNDEKEHEKFFRALRNKIDNVDMGQSSNWEEAQFYMESIVKTHVFYEPDKAIQLAQKAENIEELLKYAIQFEKDTILFFFSFSKHVKGHKADEAVDAIINEEAAHIKKLRELLKAI